MAQRLEAMEQWGHVRWCVLYCVASGWYVMWAACSGWPHDGFYEVGQQGRLGTTMVYVRCRVLFCLTVWVSSLSHGSQRVALPIWGRVHRSSGIVRRWSLEKE